MSHDNTQECRYLRAEELLGQWLEHTENGKSQALSSLLAQHPELDAELRSLARGMGIVADVVADGRARVEAERAALAELLAGVGGSEFGDRYRLDGEVGKGGMGVVFRFHDKKLGRALAMKVILGQAEASRTGRTPEVSPRMLQRFLNEARLTGQLEHPGIVPVHEVGVDGDGRAYFTMKFVKGGRWPTCSRTRRRGGRDGRGSGCCRRSCGSVTRWPTHTSAASCTGTSSRRTSWSATSGRSTSWTGVWRGGSASRRAAWRWRRRTRPMKPSPSSWS